MCKFQVDFYSSFSLSPIYRNDDGQGIFQFMSD